MKEEELKSYEGESKIIANGEEYYILTENYKTIIYIKDESVPPKITVKYNRRHEGSFHDYFGGWVEHQHAENKVRKGEIR